MSRNIHWPSTLFQRVHLSNSFFLVWYMRSNYTGKLICQPLFDNVEIEFDKPIAHATHNRVWVKSDEQMINNCRYRSCWLGFVSCDFLCSATHLGCLFSRFCGLMKIKMAGASRQCAMLMMA